MSPFELLNLGILFHIGYMCFLISVPLDVLLLWQIMWWKMPALAVGKTKAILKKKKRGRLEDLLYHRIDYLLD